MKKSLGLWGLLFPAGFWLFFFFLVPLGIVLAYSFAQRGVYGGIEWAFSLENYARALDPLYVKILWRSLGMALFTTIFCLVCGYPFAYFIAFAPARLKNLLLILLIIPFWTNFLIRTYAWIVILQEEGLINSLLLSIGVIRQPLNLLYTPTSVMLGMVYGYLPFMVLPLYSSLEKLQPALIEASMDLGANRLKTFLHVTLPLSRPGLATAALLTAVPMLCEMVIPKLLGGSRGVLMGQALSAQYLQSQNYPLGSAMAVLILIIIAAIVTALARLTKGFAEVGT